MTSGSDDRDTIFALASAAGRAGVSVMRLSGPRTRDIVKTMLGATPPQPRRASLRSVIDPVTGELIDKALVLFFEGPASFTGEDMAEFQIHGSPAVIEALAGCFYGLGLREAERGEFTRRAFENGRMDLTEAEGLADLIDAQTSLQRRQALRQMGGGLRDIYEGWREQILDALAAIEGEIDFPDEEDVPEKLALRAGPGLDKLAKALERALDESQQGEAIRHGLDIAIIGAPNAGKSTIINSLAKKEAAIVSEQAGTTRDIIEVGLTLSGLPVRLSDTAGLRFTDDEIEAEGVRRAKARAAQADLRIAVLDQSSAQAQADLEALLPLLSEDDIVVLNKADRGSFSGHVSRETLSVISIIAAADNGTQELSEMLNKIVASRYMMREDAGLTRARHRDCAERALGSVRSAGMNLTLAPELAGEDMRRALHAIKELAGEADIEAVLDRIFTRFCIGK